jgi:putative transposase
MARPLRLEFLGAVYHVTSRGNERAAIYLGDSDRTLFLDTLSKVVTKYKWNCYAYCLMGNHYHLLIETPYANLAVGMRQLNGVYTQKFNKAHQGAGHLFQGRYKAILIKKESHLLEVARYIVLNPVRAKAANDPSSWKWSSYNATAGRAGKPEFLSVDWLLGQFAPTLNNAIRRYRKFVANGIRVESIWKSLKAQSLLGDEQFVNQFKDLLAGKRKIIDIPRIQRFLDRPRLEELCENVDLKNKALRNRVITRAVYEYGYSQTNVAEFLKIHQSTISKVLNRKK